jgi:signal transduction histidine kinase
MVGKTRREVVTGGVSDEQWRIHDEDQRARRPFQKFRFQRIDASGAVHHVELNGKPVFDDGGRFVGYRGSAQDVTVEVENERELTRRVEERTAELKRVQEELLRKERLSTLGQFTATVAHELRNPLSAIRNTAFAIAEAASAHGLGLERSIGRLERSVARCDRLIADLLEYTRVRELKRMTVALDPWLGDVLDDQGVPAGIVVERDFAAAGLRLSVDADCLRRVVINLVENACQAMADMPAGDGTGAGGRRLVLRTRAVEGGATIAVEDSGPGIAPEVLPRIFDPLFSTKSFGTGLGLPTVKQIVEQHGGTIALASEPGHGARVLVRLPLSPVVVEELAA